MKLRLCAARNTSPDAGLIMFRTEKRRNPLATKAGNGRAIPAAMYCQAAKRSGVKRGGAAPGPAAKPNTLKDLPGRSHGEVL